MIRRSHYPIVHLPNCTVWLEGVPDRSNLFNGVLGSEKIISYRLLSVSKNNIFVKLCRRNFTFVYFYKKGNSSRRITALSYLYHSKCIQLWVICDYFKFLKISSKSFLLHWPIVGLHTI